MQTASLPEKKIYTYSDYLMMEDEKRYEVLEGELIMVPAPATLHQRISWKLEFIVGKFIEDNDLGAIFHAPTDVVLAEDIVVQPDILFISKERTNIIEKQAIMGVPDLIVEILSPLSTFYDVTKKKELYQRYGLKEYWLVFPEDKAIEVLTLEQGVYREFDSVKGEGVIKSKLLSGLEVGLKKVFNLKNKN